MVLWGCGSNTVDLPDSLDENKQRFINQVMTSRTVSRTSCVSIYISPHFTICAIAIAVIMLVIA